MKGFLLALRLALVVLTATYNVEAATKVKCNESDGWDSPVSEKTCEGKDVVCITYKLFMGEEDVVMKQTCGERKVVGDDCHSLVGYDCPMCEEDLCN